MSKEKAIKLIKRSMIDISDWLYNDGDKPSYKRIERSLYLALKELED